MIRVTGALERLQSYPIAGRMSRGRLQNPAGDPLGDLRDYGVSEHSGACRRRKSISPAVREPGKSLSPQDQVIYNTVLTSSGQDEIQQLNTGLPGSKNAGDLKARINDPEAELTAKALSHHSNA